MFRSTLFGCDQSQCNKLPRPASKLPRLAVAFALMWCAGPRADGAEPALIVPDVQRAQGAAGAESKKLRVLIEDPTCPSGASGMPCLPANRTPYWQDLNDFVPGGPIPAPVESGGLGAVQRGTPGPVMNFNGVLATAAGGPTPPDTHLAAGTGLGAAGRIIMVTNRSIQIWNKLGAVVAGPTPLTTFFPPPAGQTTFDPVVLFDQHMGRFFIVALTRDIPATAGTSVIRIARSNTATPGTLGPADWTFASGAANFVIGGVMTSVDYPKIGADVNALFVTTNHYPLAGGAPLGSNIRVYDKVTLGFVDMTYSGAVTPGVFTICPAHVYGTTALGHFYLINRVTAGVYRLHWVTGHPGAPIVGTATYAWVNGGMGADFTADQCPSVPDVDLDTLATRLQNAVWRNGMLYCTNSTDPDSDGETEVKWEQIPLNGNPAATPPAASVGGFINAAAATGWTYMPAIGVDNNDNVAVVFTESDPGLCPTVSYALREPALDPAGTFGATVTAWTSGGFYDSPFIGVSGAGSDRWGDYAGMVSDPSEDCFWAANEYALTSVVAGSLWGTRIVKFCTATTGACCIPPAINNTCANLTPAACAGIGGAQFRGIGSSCPTMGVVPGMHSGVATVHWAGSAIQCTAIIPRGVDGEAARLLSNCCEPHPSPGCDDEDCTSLVCNLANDCCFAQWAPHCADIANLHCGQNVCTGGPQFLQHCVSDGQCPGAVCDVGPPLCEAAPEGCQEGQRIDAIATSDDPGQETMTDLVVPFGDFFGPGSDPFQGTVRFLGDPLGDTPPYGFFDVADTIIERFNVDPDRCAIPGYEIDIPIEIVALNLVSIDPITVTYSNPPRPPQFWDVRVNQSDFQQSPIGSMTVTKTHCNGGTFTATFGVQAKFIFTEVGNPGNIRVLDTGEIPFPPDMLTVEFMPWVSDADPNFNFDSPWCTDFHPGIEDPNQDTDCDCNLNFQYDRCDIEQGISQDCNRNAKPDECDPDLDNDDVTDDCDNCPSQSNAAQTDTDSDGAGDPCDICPLIGYIDRDQDADRVDNVADNCPCVWNPGQEDDDGDGVGNVCEVGGCGSVDITQSTDPNTVLGPGFAVACYDQPNNCTVENDFARSFDLSVGATAGLAHYVRCVEYALDSMTDTTTGIGTVTVNLFTDSNGGPPNVANLVLLAGGSITDLVPTGTVAALRTVDFTANNVLVAADATLVVTVESPDLCTTQGPNNAFFDGANNSGQTAPSYIRAPDCGIPDFVTLASIGFPNQHMVMTVELDPESQAPATPLPDPTGINKVRFISLSVPSSGGATALRVKPVSLHHVNPPYTGGPSVPFPSFESANCAEPCGCNRWVGPPAQYIESTSNPIPFYASSVRCDPWYQDWSTVGLLHVTGSLIVPSSIYQVENVASACQGVEGSNPDCAKGGANVSAQLEISTNRWADVETPYNPPSMTVQPDLGDVGAEVNKFRSAPGAPIKARALIAGSDAFGNITSLNVDLGFGHIAACVDAFRGRPYPSTIAACPSPNTGACLLIDGCADVASVAECDAISGQFQGACTHCPTCGQCEEEPCPPLERENIPINLAACSASGQGKCCYIDDAAGCACSIDCGEGNPALCTTTGAACTFGFGTDATCSCTCP